MSARGCGCVEQPCGCCEGVQPLAPATECNRPGLGAISYRVGTHGQFLETMKARLSTIVVDGVAADGQTLAEFRPLQGLTTRDASDFSIALLDGWAVVGDVLSFYQERIANEGYLRTATERRSILELSRLVGYSLRPGVASTVYLAYTIDDKQSDPVTIPAGARSQSIPGPDEVPQSFETSDPLEARAAWNTFKPRMSRAQTAPTVTNVQGGGRVYLQGIDSNLKVNDAILIDYGDGNMPKPYRVLTIAPDPKFDRTLVTFADWAAVPATPVTAAGAPAGVAASGVGAPDLVNAVAGKKSDPEIGVIGRLVLPPSLPPRNTLTVTRDLKSIFARQGDISAQVVTSFQPALQDTFFAALANAPDAPGGALRVFALRAKAAPFGQIAPKKTHFDRENGQVVVDGEWPIAEAIPSKEGKITHLTHEDDNVVFLDGAYDKIQPASLVLIDMSAVPPTKSPDVAQVVPARQPYLVTLAKAVQAGIARAEYGISGKTTRLLLQDSWLTIKEIDQTADYQPVYDRDFRVLRNSTIFVQSEELLLANEPVTEDVCKGSSSWIELDGLYADLKSGRWVIVSGERVDVTVEDPNHPGSQIPVPGVNGSELVMLANVIQDVALPSGMAESLYQLPLQAHQADVPPLRPKPLPDERKHTFLQFANDLRYCYKRDKVSIYGNVVKATHGETRNEALGNGDGVKGLQSFALKQRPLTFVAAPTAVGADSSLHAYVSDVEWHETDSLAWLGPKDRGFVTGTDDTGNTTLTFGNGEHGARLPTGLLNVKAVYRNGIGNAGNVRTGQISLLQTRPLGVKEVINPMRASGGADKEGRDLARENAPLSVMPLDRLVSVQDYADFTRRFAGIAKALATKASDGRRELVYLTIAGVDDAPIDATSDLYRNLLAAVHNLGDPDLPLRVEMRELKMLVLSAKLRLKADYQWEPVVVAVRARLLDAFGFGKRALGQPVLLSEVISAIQTVRGVAYVDIDALGAIPERTADKTEQGATTRRPLTPAEISAQVQFVLDPSAVLKIAVSLAARDRLPRNVDVWAGGPDKGELRPAELAIFAPAVPDTLILNQIL